MTDLWPWLAIAGLGALHGLNPATGWMFAAARGVQAHDDTQARRALIPIAIGHVASIAVVVWTVAHGLSMDRALVQGAAGALLIGLAMIRLLRGTGRHPPLDLRAGHAGMALWSFLMATAHGAGLMLVPALVPLCVAGGAASAITASGSLILAVAAVAVHTAAMLVATGGIASAVCRGAAIWPRALRGAVLPRAWTATLATTGVLLVTLA
jgi:hypothetical protein